jgi:hypothetical protein
MKAHLSRAGIFEAARAIRRFLEVLIPERSGAVDAELVAILTQGETEGGELLLLEVFQRHKAMREWVAGFLRAGRDASRGFAMPPGDPGFIAAERYACPEGDYSWYLSAVGEVVPPCPTHRVPLVPAEFS